MQVAAPRGDEEEGVIERGPSRPPYIRLGGEQVTLFASIVDILQVVPFREREASGFKEGGEFERGNARGAERVNGLRVVVGWEGGRAG